MTKVFKRLTSLAAAIIMTLTLMISVSADCSHGNFSTSEYGAPHYSTSTHTVYVSYSPYVLTCTVTTRTVVLATSCGYCGAIVSYNNSTSTTHSISH